MNEPTDLFESPSPQPTQKTNLTKQRLSKASAAILAEPPERLGYLHSVLCQCGLPYRAPDPDVRVWERINGDSHLKVMAGEVMDPKTHRLVEVPLPFGPKARLILYHLNSEAVRTQSAVINVGKSLTDFVRRLLNADPNGREIAAFKSQLTALAAASIRLGMVKGNHAVTYNTQIVTALDLWFHKDDRQRVLWDSTVVLGHDYFISLVDHAVPLDERAIVALAHSALALDIYSWLVQRLHRIGRNVSQEVSWSVLHEQFGQGYAEIHKFRSKFLTALTAVRTQYRAANIEPTERGLVLRNSPPPIAKRSSLVHKPAPAPEP